MDYTYYRFENLDYLTRQEYGIKSPKRLDCTYSYSGSGGGRGIDKLAKGRGQYEGMLFGYKGKAYNLQGDKSFTINQINISTIMYDCTDCLKGFGNPPQDCTELMEYRNDGYLFTFNRDYSLIELVIIPDGRYGIDASYGEFLDGELDDDLEELRSLAKPFYTYTRMQLTLL